VSASLPYIIIALVAIVIVAVLVFMSGKNRENNRLTPLAGLAFGFILAGVLFGENLFLGYAFLLLGIVVAVIDIIMRGRQK
jgi:uncharacterized membrane protein